MNPYPLTPGSSIAAAFKDYREKVIPSQAIPMQILECRRAFYAGASALLMELMRLEAGAPGVEPSHEQLLDGAEFLERVRLELEAFARNGAR